MTVIVHSLQDRHFIYKGIETANLGEGKGDRKGGGVSNKHTKHSHSSRWSYTYLIHQLNCIEPGYSVILQLISFH